MEKSINISADEAITAKKIVGADHILQCRNCRCRTAYGDVEAAGWICRNCKSDLGQAPSLAMLEWAPVLGIETPESYSKGKLGKLISAKQLERDENLVHRAAPEHLLRQLDKLADRGLLGEMRVVNLRTVSADAIVQELARRGAEYVIRCPPSETVSYSHGCAGPVYTVFGHLLAQVHPPPNAAPKRPPSEGVQRNISPGEGEQWNGDGES